MTRRLMDPFTTGVCLRVTAHRCMQWRNKSTANLHDVCPGAARISSAASFSCSSSSDTWWLEFWVRTCTRIAHSVQAWLCLERYRPLPGSTRAELMLNSQVRLDHVTFHFTSLTQFSAQHEILALFYNTNCLVQRSQLATSLCANIK